MAIVRTFLPTGLQLRVHPTAAYPDDVSDAINAVIAELDYVVVVPPNLGPVEVPDSFVWLWLHQNQDQVHLLAFENLGPDPGLPPDPPADQPPDQLLAAQAPAEEGEEFEEGEEEESSEGESSETPKKKKKKTTSSHHHKK